jgi:hypothetical protein
MKIVYTMYFVILLTSIRQGINMKNYEWFTPIETLFLFLSILMTSFLIADIVLIVYKLPIPYAFYVAHFILIIITVVSILGFLLISWSLKRQRTRDAVLLEHTLKIAQLEHRLAALNSAPRTAKKAVKVNAS